MVCWEINLVTVEFNMSNIGILTKYLAENNITYAYNETRNIMFVGSNYNRITLDFNKKTASFSGNFEGQKRLNELKVGYSKAVVAEVARKKKWAVKNLGANKLALRRY